jgi:hypothetical protein
MFQSLSLYFKLGFQLCCPIGNTGFAMLNPTYREVNQLRQDFTFLSQGIKGSGIAGNIDVTVNYSSNRKSDRARKTINSTD